MSECYECLAMVWKSIMYKILPEIQGNTVHKTNSSDKIRSECLISKYYAILPKCLEQMHFSESVEYQTTDGMKNRSIGSRSI